MTVEREGPERARSRAEPKPRRRPTALLGAIGVCAVIALAIVTLLRERAAFVPSGLGGARFGMNAAELMRRFPDLERKSQQPLVLSQQTRLFERAAHCDYELEFRGTLSRMSCRFEPAASTAETRRTEQSVLVTLRKLYGDESRIDGARHLWAGARGSLVFEEASTDGKTLLINTWSNHPQP